MVPDSILRKYPSGKVLLHNFLLWNICGIYKLCPVPLFCKFCKLAVHFNFFEAKLAGCCYRPIRAKFAKGHSKLYPFMKNDKQRLPNEYVIEKMYDL